MAHLLRPYQDLVGVFKNPYRVLPGRCNLSWSIPYRAMPRSWSVCKRYQILGSSQPCLSGAEESCLVSYHLQDPLLTLYCKLSPQPRVVATRIWFQSQAGAGGKEAGT